MFWEARSRDFLAFVLMAPAGSAEAFFGGLAKAKRKIINNATNANCRRGGDSSSSVSSVPSSSITVVSPNGGETLQGGKSYTIKWKTKGISKKEKVSILLEVADDDRGISIATSTTNRGVYKWKVPGNVSGSNFKVAVTLKSVWDKSDEFFSIVAKNSFQKSLSHRYYWMILRLDKPLIWFGMRQMLIMMTLRGGLILATARQ